MGKWLKTCIAMYIGCWVAMPGTAQTVDYYEANRAMIRNGVQAVLTCNGLFTSERRLDQVFAEELAYLGERVIGTASDGNYSVDLNRKGVLVGGGTDGAQIGAVFREGIGCVVMPPGMALEATAAFPSLPSFERPSDLDSVPWPKGDQVPALTLPEARKTAVQAVSNWAFDRALPEQVTVSLLIVKGGQIIHERYAPGFNRHTKTRTWSTAKSIAATLIGMRVGEGRLSLDQSLDVSWLPELKTDDLDPRDAITLQHALHMSTGLYPVDSFRMEYTTGSGLSYWAGASSVKGALNRGLVREPGSYWEYENYDTLLAVLALKQSFENPTEYLSFPQTALFRPLGMNSTLASTDRFGDFIFSSQVYTNARDLARFGLLHLNRGEWQGERLVSEEWIDFMVTPAPSSDVRGNDYGAHWWLVPDDRKKDVPANAYSSAGTRGQYVIVAPSHDLVVVRRGLDFGRQGFDQWELLANVIAALAE